MINTDADQIIIANVTAHAAGQLPPITYGSGGLGGADIRRSVCDILEGGETAFKERARRLRVRLPSAGSRPCAVSDWLYRREA